MAKKTVCLLALTLSEWLNWVAAGRLRLNNRIVQIDSQKELEGFAAVMYHAPDNSFFDDGAYILAELKPDWSVYQEVLESFGAASVMWLGLESVKEFIPVSERGALLLKGDAHRARVALGQPKYENAWNAWRNNETRSRADQRGKLFVRTLGLKEPKLNSIPSDVLPFLLGDKKLPNADKAVKLGSTRALAWAKAFSVFGILVGEEEKVKQAKDFGLSEIIKKLLADYSMNCPIIYKSSYLCVADNLSLVIKEKKGINVSVSLLVVVFHYLGIIFAEKEVSLKALLEDLEALGENNDSALASNAAYLIGRNMSDIQVTTLFYDVFSDVFLFLDSKSLSIYNNISNYSKKNRNKMPEHEHCNTKDKFQQERSNTKNKLIHEQSNAENKLIHEQSDTGHNNQQEPTNAENQSQQEQSNAENQSHQEHSNAENKSLQEQSNIENKSQYEQYDAENKLIHEQSDTGHNNQQEPTNTEKNHQHEQSDVKEEFPLKTQAPNSFGLAKRETTMGKDKPEKRSKSKT
ncbi:MAG: hypothetical protein LBT47_00705 [Deltaproteobacteria bacterium]|jgi:hypothetical protein|nr:hypothetical protein [Deltaproteobacteria bacterium]